MIDTARSPVVRELRVFLSRLAPVPALVFVTTGVALFVYQYYGSADFFEDVLARRLFPAMKARDVEAASYFYWFGSAFVLLGIAPWALLRLASRREPIATGLGLGDWRLGLPAAALFYGVMVPLLAGAVWLFPESFLDYYPMYRGATRTVAMFVAYECAYLVYFIAWEYFFRGFMTFGLERTLGVWTVFVQMLPFTVMHFGKPDAEALSSIAGALALGWLALRTRSIWYGVIVHGLTAVSLDLVVVAVRGAG